MKNDKKMITDTINGMYRIRFPDLRMYTGMHDDVRTEGYATDFDKRI